MPSTKSCLEALRFDGAWVVRRAVTEAALASLEQNLPAADGAGKRLAGLPWLANWIDTELSPLLVRHGLSDAFRPVRAILFDKSTETNWSLGWHQDRTVAVRGRIDAEGYGPWSSKQGLQHVEPPFAVMERMLTIRLHIDPVDCDNAPLRVALGSHRCGRISDGMVDDVAKSLPELICLADRGDLWLYATPILHASAAAVRPGSRRALQLDLASDPLPGGVEWLGVA